MSNRGSAAATAAAWLSHPVTCGALVLLLVNDHLLKAAWGSWFTGKLSDFAWLIVAPPLLAVIATFILGDRAPTAARRTYVVCLGVVGIVFVLVKSTVVGAGLASTALSAVAGPSLVRADLTDLLALPALGVAWAVARGAQEPEGGVARRPDPRTGMRWLALLPLAVLATAATSQASPSGAMQVGVADGVLLIADSDGFGPEGATWYLSSDGEAWDRHEHWIDGPSRVVEEFKASGGMPESACVPGHSEICYRAADQGLGVDRSRDGGTTWRSDWSVSEEASRALAERYEPGALGLFTVGVAVLPDGDSYRVFAANAGDGLAVRHEDGTWERLGFAYRSNAPPVVPLPGEPTRWSHPVPWSVLLGVLAAWVVLFLSGLRRQERQARNRRGRVAIALSLLLLVPAAALNRLWGVVEGQKIGATVVIGGRALVPAVVGGLVLAAMILLAFSTDRSGRGSTGRLMVFTGVGVTVAAALIPQPALAAFVMLAVVVAGTAAARTSDGSAATAHDG